MNLFLPETKWVLTINKQERPEYTSLDMLIAREGGLEHIDCAVARQTANQYAAHPDVISVTIDRVTTERVAVFGHGMYK